MKFTSIQMLRGLAALMVALFHIGAVERLGIEEAGASEAGLVSGLWLNGLSGVDLFFVISGFIMVYVTGSAQPGLRTSGAFLFARISRIYPLWWLFSTVMMVYFVITLGTLVDMEKIGAQDLSPAGYLTFSYLLLPQAVHPQLSLGWTLIHEMYFYLVFALLLFLPRRFLIPGLFAWALAIFAGFALGWTRPHGGSVVALAFHPLTLEFLMGAAAAFLVMSGRRFMPIAMIALGAGLFLGVMQFTPDPSHWNTPQAHAMLEWKRVLYYGAPAAILVYGLASFEVEGRYREWKPLTHLGDWSYALYLSHIIVASGLKRTLPTIANIGETKLGLPSELMNLLRLGTPGIWDNVTFIILCVAAVIIFAGLTHICFEKPVLRLTSHLRKRLFPNAARSLAPGAIQARVW